MDLDESATELNFDPNPVIEERESVEQIYHQKVYLRQLQPPTPQPVEIQVQEVLIPPPPPKSPIHVRVAQAQARTPSPILIKSAPPPPPPSQERDQPIVYNKYIPPPKQAPRQIIIHHYPELPPKPRLSFLSLVDQHVFLFLSLSVQVQLSSNNGCRTNRLRDGSSSILFLEKLFKPLQLLGTSSCPTPNLVL